MNATNPSVRRLAGVLTLGAVAGHVLGLTVFIAGALSRGVDMALLAGPPSERSFAALVALEPYPWIAVWIGVTSWLLMGMAPVGLHAALAGRSRLTTAAAALFFLGLAAGTLHFGPDGIGWTILPARAMAEGANRELYLFTAGFLRDVSLFFEKVWGLARGSSMLIFTLALGGALGWRRAIVWFSAFGALEFVFRIPTILANAPINPLIDLPYVVWLTAIGAWLAFGERR